MLIKVVKAICLLVVIAAAVIYGRYFISKAARGRAALESVTRLHTAADIEGDELFRSRISKFDQIGILGERVAESKADTCYIESLYAGFTVASWVQYCKLDYVAGYTALLSREETFARLQALHKEDSTFPAKSPGRVRCRFSIMPSNSVTYVPAAAISDGDDYCRIPDVVIRGEPSGVGRPASTLFDYTFDPGTIDQNVDLVWVTYTLDYYRESLGCGLFPLCLLPPRSTPIQAE